MTTRESFIDTLGVQHMHVPVVCKTPLGLITRAGDHYQVWWKQEHLRYRLTHAHITEEQLGYFRSTLGA